MVIQKLTSFKPDNKVRRHFKPEEIRIIILQHKLTIELQDLIAPKSLLLKHLAAEHPPLHISPNETSLQMFIKTHSRAHFP